MSLLSKKVIITSLLIAVIYLLTVIYFMNFSLVKMTIAGDFPVNYKFEILLSLLEGMWTAMTHTELILLILIAFLTGINFTLIGKRIIKMKTLKNTHFVVGGWSLLAFITSGCAVCGGLPFLSLLGLSGSIAFLPFHGSEFSYISLALLSISLYMLLTKNESKTNCKIPVKSNQLGIKANKIKSR